MQLWLWCFPLAIPLLITIKDRRYAAYTPAQWNCFLFSLVLWAVAILCHIYAYIIQVRGDRTCSAVERVTSDLWDEANFGS